MCAPVFIGIFSDSPDVIAFGVRQARVEALFYCMLALAHCIAGIMRGAGKATVPMFTMLGFWCVLRVAYITLMLHFYPYIEVVFTAYPLTWGTSCVVFLLFFSRQTGYIISSESTGRKVAAEMCYIERSMEFICFWIIIK